MKIEAILIGMLLLLCTFLFIDRSCTSRKLDIAKGKYKNQKVVTLDVELKADKKIGDLKSVIVEKDKEIESLEESVQRKVKIDSGLNLKTRKLEEEYIELRDKDEMIVNLRSQVNNWKERFSLANGIIENQKGIIFSLRAKYDTQVKITLEWESKFNAERALRVSAEDVIKEAMKEIRALKFKSKLKTGGMAVVAGILLYSVLK